MDRGYIVQTVITDGYGRETFQHSQIFRTREQAEQIAALSRPLKAWERKIERSVQECRTVFSEDDSTEALAAESYVPARAA